jgi:hypothetical protein
MVLLRGVKEFDIKEAVANHCLGVHRKEVFGVLRGTSIPVIYGPIPSHIK